MWRLVFVLLLSGALGCELFMPGAIPCDGDGDCLADQVCISGGCAAKTRTDAGRPPRDAGDPPVVDGGPKIVDDGGFDAGGVVDAGLGPQDAGVPRADAGVIDAGLDAGVDPCGPAPEIVVSDAACPDLQLALDNVDVGGRVLLQKDVSGAFTSSTADVTLEGAGATRPRLSAEDGDGLVLAGTNSTVRFVELVSAPGSRALVVQAAGALLHRNTFSGRAPNARGGEGAGLVIEAETRVIANHFWGWLNPAISVDKSSGSQLQHNHAFIFPPVAIISAVGAGLEDLSVTHNDLFGMNPTPNAPAIDGLVECGGDNVNNRARGQCDDPIGPQINPNAFLTTLNGPCMTQVFGGATSNVGLEDHAGRPFPQGTTAIGALGAVCDEANPAELELQRQIDAAALGSTLNVDGAHEGPLFVGRAITIDDPSGQMRVRVDQETAVSVFYVDDATLRGLVVERTGTEGGRVLLADSQATNARLVVDRFLVRDPAGTSAVGAAFFARGIDLNLKNSAVSGPFDAFLDLETGPDRSFIYGNSFHSSASARVLNIQNNNNRARIRCSIFSTPGTDAIAVFESDNLTRANVFLHVENGETPGNNSNCLANEIGNANECPPSADVFIDTSTGDLRRAFIANLEDANDCQFDAQALAEDDLDRGGCQRNEPFSIGAYELGPDAGPCGP